MLHRFRALLGRFRRDEGGAFLVLFGVLALVLVATSGAVVDFTRLEQTRTKAQNALDAAALGLQPHVFDTSPAWTPADFVREADKLLDERIGDSSIASTVTSATINVRNGQLILNAWVEVPTAFVALVGVNKVKSGLLSEATRKRLNLEVSMVLDNSGSMYYYSRMTELKKAAKSATDILFDNQATLPNVFVSIVPFTQYVNVGTANRTASWMSQTGASSISHLNFDDDDNDTTAFTGTVNRWSLYDGFNNEPWAGCVEARVTPYDAQDTVPNNAVPDTMFQPVFAPDSSADNYLSNDSPASCTNREPKYVWTQTKYSCNKSVSSSNINTATNNYNTADCTGSGSAPNLDVYETVSELGVTTAATSTPPTSMFNNPYPGATAYSDSYQNVSGNGSNRTIRRTRTWTYVFSTKEYQERLCKYSGASYTSDGANSDCPTTTILPLTNVRQTVKDQIDLMVADGSTNIEQGAIWGFHSLSPTEPLTEGTDYDEATSKVLIVMTDGENNPNYDTYTNTPYGNSSWMAWGYRVNKRLLTESTTPKDSLASQAQVIAEVNRRTVLACANARAQGIIVYTIGLSAPNATTIQMLKDCANPSEVIAGQTRNYWYFPTDSAELTDVFEEIASQLSELRLAQ